MNTTSFTCDGTRTLLACLLCLWPLRPSEHENEHLSMNNGITEKMDSCESTMSVMKLYLHERMSPGHGLLFLNAVFAVASGQQTRKGHFCKKNSFCRYVSQPISVCSKRCRTGPPAPLLHARSSAARKSHHVLVRPIPNYT